MFFTGAITETYFHLFNCNNKIQSNFLHVTIHKKHFEILTVDLKDLSVVALYPLPPSQYLSLQWLMLLLHLFSFV